MESLLQDQAFLMNMGMVVFMFAIFYFLIIRPQKKADQKRDFFQNNLKRGDKVLSAGGIYGTITAIGEQKVSLKVAENVEIEVLRASITRYQDTSKQELLEKEFSGKK